MDYMIQPTKNGDFIVRGSNGREYAKFNTLTESAEWISVAQAQEAAEFTINERQRHEQEAFDETVPQLNEMQLRWQNYRSWFYDALCRFQKGAQGRRSMLSQQSGFGMDDNLERHVTDDQNELLAVRGIYERAVKIDSAIKKARAGKDAQKLDYLLSDVAEKTISEMLEHFSEFDRPSDKTPRERSGTKPDTSIALGDERKAWLKKQGGIQPIINRMIDDAMRDE